MGIKVKLRQKAISGNRQSLYLDFYPAVEDSQTGKLTRREFLNRFLFDEVEHEEQHYKDSNGKEQVRYVPVLDKNGKPKKLRLDPISKQHNIETVQLASQIRMKRENQLNKPEIYTDYEKEQMRIKELGDRDFVIYFCSLADKRKASNYDNWISASKYLKSFTGGSLKFSALSEKLCNDFKDYLLTTSSNKSNSRTLARNSAVSYFNKFKACLRQAFKDGVLQIDLNAKVPAIKPEETKRSYLILEELNSLVKTKCSDPILKTAALFSALTGLRFSDIQKLIWGEVEFCNEQGYSIHFKQKKTKGVEVQPISEQAYKLLGERRENSSRVFDSLEYSATQNGHLSNWIKAAEIKKENHFSLLQTHVCHFTIEQGYRYLYCLENAWTP